MAQFDFRDGELFAEGTSVSEIAETVGTPCYIYSREAFEQHWEAYDSAFGDHPHLVCFAVKANSNLAVLNVLAKKGSGFDIVSGGELKRVIAAGGDPEKIVFSGVAKTEDDIALALMNNIKSINIESPAELDRIQKVAESMDMIAPISVRVNPDVDPETHPYISTGLEEAKFGVPMSQALEVYQRAQAASHIHVHGIACHIGSQITTTNPFIDALNLVLALVKEIKAEGIEIEHLDLGGGLGITYSDETPPSPKQYIDEILSTLKANDIDLPVSLEPGRSIAGNAGILVTKVEYLKSNEGKNFAIVDAAMNDLMRPSLYDAFHDIVPVKASTDKTEAEYDVVGPVCETGDILGKNRTLAVDSDDLLAIKSAGAYGFVMASNYNTRPRAAEIMADGEKWHTVRKRETVEELYALEKIIS